MTDVPEQLQVFLDESLDVVGLTRDPLWVGQYKASNVLQRSLAHLVGYDGQFSRPLLCTTGGVLYVNDVAGGFTGTYKRGIVSANVAGDNVIIAAVPTKSLCVVAMLLTSQEHVHVIVKSGVGGGATALTPSMTMNIDEGQASCPIILPAPTDPRACWFKTLPGEELSFYLGEAGMTIFGAVVYYEE